MKLSIKNKGESKFSPEYEILIDGKPIEGDQLTNISINMPADDIPKVVLTYDIDELDVENLGVGEGTGSINAGTIKVADITAGTIKAHGIREANIKHLADRITDQNVDEIRKIIK